jgi:hypothetical protein
MIAQAKSLSPSSSAHRLHAKFTELLPSIQNHARVAFRSVRPELRDELIAEVCANCWVAFVRLMERGLDDVIYAAPLALYAIRQVRSGRKVGIRANVNDVTSRHCQVHKGVRVGRLDHYNVDKDEWKEVLIEDRHAGPAETAIAKIDVGNWFEQLKPRDRAIASYLAMGNGTNDTAKEFRVSKGRIAQKRREFLERWRCFQGEPLATAAVA